MYVSADVNILRDWSCTEEKPVGNPNNFGRLIAYLTLVYKIADSYEEEIVREAVQGTVENLKHIDLEKYKVGRFISFKTLLGQLLIRLISAYCTWEHMQRQWHVSMNESLRVINKWNQSQCPLYSAFQISPGQATGAGCIKVGRTASRYVGRSPNVWRNKFRYTLDVPWTLEWVAPRLLWVLITSDVNMQIDHFHNGKQFKYSIMCILISLLGLVSVSVIE